MNYRKSKQRDEILNTLKNSDIHPTANWIYDQLKEDNPNLSLGTVYRNLGILVEQGFVEKINFGSTFDRYEAKKKDHYHFICEKCGDILDLEMPIKLELNTEVSEFSQLNARRHRIEFFGICRSCM